MGFWGSNSLQMALRNEWICMKHPTWFSFASAKLLNHKFGRRTLVFYWQFTLFPLKSRVLIRIISMPLSIHKMYMLYFLSTELEHNGLHWLEVAVMASLITQYCHKYCFFLCVQSNFLLFRNRAACRYLINWVGISLGGSFRTIWLGNIG